MKCYFVFCLALLLGCCSLASGAVVEHTFDIGNMTVSPLCKKQVIIAVNGSLPGPTIYVEEGDTLVVHAINNSPYNITLHWHGIFQLLTAWADGPESVTQCPIGPRGRGNSYPFPSFYQEVPILLGEWWNDNVVDVENNAIASGLGPNISDAYTINGFPGNSYNCNQTLPVGGWAVIRFTANNPGIWLVHCHLETHLPWGLGMAFEVENGPEPWVLPPPPTDLPQC
ncbi:hypothetical protein VNO78_25731 [Psophocarpus tetragonolobus]|uniref:Laccase n=1 Tax=Psophocarpus tetragonolobus TaxID=3891 RepID=A0AAN9S7G6_PSOTE